MGTLVFIDELKLEVQDGIQDCDCLTALSNLEFFIAVNPLVDVSGSSYEVRMPNHSNILAKQLTGRHRNCVQVYQLFTHMAATDRSRMHLMECQDPIKGILLPDGEDPLWIVGDLSGNIQDLLSRLIDNNYIKRGANVTVVSNKEENAINSWIE